MSTVPAQASRSPLGVTPSRRRLVLAALIVIGLQPIAALVAMLADLPAQFGTETAPGPYLEWLVQGSAISAPVAPVVLLAAGALLARRADRWGLLGVALTALAAVLFLIGGLGETFWSENDGEVSETVLAASTVAWVLVGLTLLALAARAVRERG